MISNSILQGTDFSPSTTSGSSISTSQVENETIGSQKDGYQISLFQNLDLIESALDTVCKVKDKDAKNQAMRLLMTIREIIRALQNRKVPLSHLPPLWASELDDGSILLEWAFPDFRVGFGIEPDPNNSSWYLVSNKKLEEINVSGNLTEKNLVSTIVRLFSFILANS